MAAPLFLLAPPRSFTSVINAMLGQHPQAFGLPEFNLFNSERVIDLWHAVPGEPPADPKLRHGLLRAVAEIYTGEQTDETIEFAEHWCAAREDWSSGAVFREIAEKLHPLVPVEKSPAYTTEIRRMERIIETFPDARFIHLIRHPIKQCESTMDLSDGVFPLFVNAIEYQDDTAILEPQLAWHDININILNFLENSVPQEQHMRIRGEDLLANPEQRLGEICRWLGLRDDMEAIEAMMHPEHSPFACVGPVTALFGNDPKFLKGAKFRKHTPKIPPLDGPVSWRKDGKGLYKEVIALAREFGY
jgi:hypothetical protein